MNTKESILYESLKLFSINGYDAVSTRMIARAINASDAVIYKHFSSKQEIFDSIVDMCRKRLDAKRNEENLEKLGWDDMERICMDRFSFLTEDEWIVLFKRILFIEQFKNPMMGDLYKDIFVEYPIGIMASYFQRLIDKGYMKKGNPRVYAIELYSPFLLYSNEKEITIEVKLILKEHVLNFQRNVVCIDTLLEGEE